MVKTTNDSDDFTQLVNPRSLVGAAEMGSSLLPGAAGHIVGGAANIAGSIIGADEDSRELAEALGVPNLRFLAGQSAAIRELQRQMDDAPTSNLAKYGTATAGTIAGGALGGALLGSSVPFVGTIAGGLAGGMAASSAYSAINGERYYNPVVAAAQIGQLQKAGETVDDYRVFLAMSATLPRGEREMINNEMGKAAGNERKMKDVANRYKHLVESKAMALLGDKYDPAGDALEQVTRVINEPDAKTGRSLNPVVLLLDHYSEAQGLGSNMARMGVAVADGDQPLPQPPGRGGKIELS
jgi:hypothetical protein